jgi:alpha-galactosidase
LREAILFCQHAISTKLDSKTMKMNSLLRTMAFFGCSLWFLAASGREAIAGAPQAGATADGYRDLSRHPDTVTVVTETGELRLNGAAGVWSGGGIRVSATVQADGLHVGLAAPQAEVKRVQLFWQGAPEAGAWKYLGDAWERGYGDLEWKTLDGKRPMPWYVLASNGRSTHAYGVMTLPAALCCWKLDKTGLTLLADVRCGGKGVQLGNRTLEVCTVVSRRGRAGETPFAAAGAFCRLLCPHPRMPKQPVYGFNDWYCDYGNISAAGVRQDAEFIARLAPAGGNRPYMVIDEGWQADRRDTRGEWDRGNAKFPDMAGLASDMVKAGTRPGIWVRLLTVQAGQPQGWKLPRDRAYLDPSAPEVRAYVMATVKRLRGWGYELIKHDFSTDDLCGRWGFEMGDAMIRDGWAFADRSRTTAEIIIDHYRSIREAAGDDVVVIGCNTIGHLSAGIFEVSRAGDDTSGQEWARTRKMGVNALAFRLPQHGAFFAVDADCVGQTAANSVPWDKNRQWLDLVAHSGTPLFVSFKRGTVTAEQEQALKEALAVASRPLPTGEPIDWFETLLPRRWKVAGSEREFNWADPPANRLMKSLSRLRDASVRLFAGR